MAQYQSARVCIGLTSSESDKHTNDTETGAQKVTTTFIEIHDVVGGGPRLQPFWLWYHLSTHSLHLILHVSTPPPHYNLGVRLGFALARSRSCLRKILPEGLFGIWSTMITPPLRNLCFATRVRTHSCISLENAVDSLPGRGLILGTTYALDEEVCVCGGGKAKLGYPLRITLK